MDKRWMVLALASVVFLTSQAQELTKANTPNALNAAAAWVEAAVPGSGNTLVWDSTVSTPANATNTMGSSFAAAGLRVVNPVADVRINGTTLALTNGAAGITVTNTRSLYIDTPVLTAEGSSQAWTVGGGRTLTLGRTEASSKGWLGGGMLSILGAGSVVFADSVEDATTRVNPLNLIWNGPAGTVGSSASRKNMILTNRGATNTIVTLSAGSLSVYANNDNYGLAIGMKLKEEWNLSGGTVTVDSGSAFHIGGAGNYATALSDGKVTLSGTAKLAVQGTLPLYLSRPGTGAVATRGTVTLDGGTLETARTIQKVVGTAGNTAAFHFNGGLLKATGSNTNWFQNLDTLDVLEGGAAIEVVAGAQALIRQPLTHGGAAATDGGLVKSGAGTLGVANAFTGALDVQAGVLGLENVPDGDVSVAAGAGLAFKNPADLAAALTDLSGKYTLDPTAAGGLYYLANANNQALSATDFGSHPFVKMGVGTLTLNTAAALGTFTGGVVVAGGALEYRAANALASGTPITVQNGGQLQVYGAATLNTHPLTLSGNYDTGDGSGALYVSRDTYTTTFAQPITLAGDTKIKSFSAWQILNFNVPISGTGNLVIGGGGALASHVQTINLNAANTFAGDVTLKSDAGSNARFTWGVDNAMPASAVLALGGPSWNSTYAMIDFKGYAQTTKGLADAATIGAIRFVTNSAATASVLTLTDSANRSYSGALGGRIDIVKTGSGTQSLTGNGLGHTGTVAVQAGVLTVGANSLPNADVAIANGARLLQSADGVTTVGRVTLTGNGGGDSRGALYLADGSDTWNGGIVISGTARIGAYGGGTLTKTLTGPISGTGTLNIWAGGGGIAHNNVFVLSGQSSLTGTLNMEASFGANLTVKLTGGDNRLPETATALFNPTWDNGANRVFCLLDLAGSSQRAAGLSTRTGDHLDHCRAVVNSSASTVSTLTLNTLGGTSAFEGVIGTNGPCPSVGSVTVVKQGAGAQLFKKGTVWAWINGASGTNCINANVTVSEGAIGFSGADMLGAANTVTVGAGGALIAPNKATLDALRADGRFTLDPSAAVGLYDTWDVSAADPARLFYYSGTAAPSTDNTATLPNGVAFAGGVVNISRDGAPGDTVFGPATAPLYLNGTTIKNNSNSPILAANRTITLNAGGTAFTAGWSKDLTVLSKLTGVGGFNVNCDTGVVLLSNPANDYAGDTTIATLWAGYSGALGKLKLGTSEVIPHGAGKGNLLLNTGATLDLNGFSETVNGLSSAAANALITNSASTVSVLTVGANDATSRYAGQTGGKTDLVKTGTGTLTLAAPCRHDGSTTVAGGTLALDSDCTLASKTVTVHRDATLAFGGGDAFGGAVSVSELFVGQEGVAQGAQGRLSIPAGIEVTVFHLAVNGLFKKAGTWGPAGSGATYIDDAIFTGGGTLRVLEAGPARGTILRLK